MLKELREFAIKGNVVDMAVGIMIGAAFTTVVKSLVDDIMMPPFGLVTGDLDFSDRFLMLREGNPGAPYSTLAKAREAGSVVIAYGQLINHVISFVVVALVLFFVVRWINRLRRPSADPTPTTMPCRFCKSIISIEASRCPNCTSQLEAAPAAKA